MTGGYYIFGRFVHISRALLYNEIDLVSRAENLTESQNR